MRAILSTLMLSLLSAPAFAVEQLPIPEPGSLALIGIAGVAGLTVYLRNKKK